MEEYKNDMSSTPARHCMHTLTSILPLYVGALSLRRRFIWPASGGLIVNAGSYTSKKVESSDIAQRLLEVYVEPSRTVSKELLQCVTDNIDKL